MKTSSFSLRVMRRAHRGPTVVQVSVSYSAKLSSVGKLWLFSLESFRCGRHCAVIPHAEKLPDATAPVGTVENARSAQVVNGLSTRTRHPVYMSTLCYCYTTCAHPGL